MLATVFWLASAGAVEGFRVQTLHAGTAHEAIYGLCFNEQRGVAVGQAGLILHSTDGGDTWTEAVRFTESAVLDVDCGADFEIYVGQSGEIFRGNQQAVEAVASGTEARLMSVAQSPDGKLAIAVGAFGTILRSMDAGESWEPSTVDWFTLLDDYVEPHLYDVHISDQGLVTIIGEFSLILQSSDQGTSWKKRNQGTPSLFGLSIDRSGNGYAVGQEGRLLATVDAGESWVPIETPTDEALLNVADIGKGKLVAIGVRTFIVSPDRGNSWTSIKSPILASGWYQGLKLLPRVHSGTQEILVAGQRANILKIGLQ